MKNSVLKLLINVENLLGVYRNYNLFSARKRILVSFRIVIEIIFSLFVTVKTYDYSEDRSNFRYIYFCFNLTLSLMISLEAILKSAKFINIMMIIDQAQMYFSEDQFYLKNIKRTRLLLKITIIIYMTTRCCTVIYIIDKYLDGENEQPLFVCIMLVFYQSETRYVIEYFVIVGIIFILSEQVKSITRRISKSSEAGGKFKASNVIVRQDFFSSFEWKKKYTIIKDCYNHVNDVFRLQIAVLLSAAALHLIILGYGCIAQFYLLDNVLRVDVINIMHRAISFIVVFYILSYGGESMKESVETLKRKLARIMIRSTADRTKYKTVKDFLRLVTNQSLLPQVFGTINIDMTLVPTFVMFLTTYLVIIIQIKNIV